MPRSSNNLAWLAFIVVTATSTRANAAPAQGFLVERFEAAPAGSAWLVLDDLTLAGGLGGAAALTGGYAHDSLVVQTGGAPLAVVSEQAHANLGLALTYDRYRLSLDLSSPIYVRGQSGTAAGQQYTAPRIDIGSHPDTVTDIRLGLDARLWGEVGGPLRLGAGVHVFLPSGESSDYLTDGTWRAVLQLLAAGDVAQFAYAAQLGMHNRPSDDVFGRIGPRGSELRYGLAGGVRLPWARPDTAIIVGSELFGATARDATALEGLVTGRLERNLADGRLMRVKLGIGGGLHAQFGAPEWRAVLAVEVLGQAAPANAPDR